MAQNTDHYIKMGRTSAGAVKIFQPDEGLGYDFETTYTEDTDRLQNGVLYLRPMFTVEALSYKATNVPTVEVAAILSFIARGNPFYLHYFSPLTSSWTTKQFYVGKGSLSIGRLTDNNSYFDEISFQMTGVNPI